jgi:hypothetical protein
MMKRFLWVCGDGGEFHVLQSVPTNALAISCDKSLLGQELYYRFDNFTIKNACPSCKAIAVVLQMGE